MQNKLIFIGKFKNDYLQLLLLEFSIFIFSVEYESMIYFVISCHLSKELLKSKGGTGLRAFLIKFLYNQIIA